MTALILANPVNLDGSVFDIVPHDSVSNPSYVQPFNSRLTTIILICFGLVGLVAIGRKEGGGRSNGQNNTP